jgi:FkbM family methyltransferase
MRILWLSNAPWSKTGYGNQTSVFTPRLNAAGHLVAISSFYGSEGGILNWKGIPVYPKAYNQFGQDITAAHAQHFNADLIISLMDVWVCEPARLMEHGCAFAPWFPVDSFPLPRLVFDHCKDATARLVFSRFGEQMVHEAGLDCHYIPHGVDTTLFSPGDQAEARQKLNWHPDTFVALMVAANKGSPSRKEFTNQITAFAHLARKHPDARLYLHTNDGAAGELHGENLPALISDLGIERQVRFADPYLYTLGHTEQHMVDLYRAADVLLGATRGEGFGIPIIEAQACACPVIVGDWTAMGELCFGGWLVPPPSTDVVGYGHIDEPTRTRQGAYQYTPRVGDVLERLEDAYQEKSAGWMHERQQLARTNVLAYDADHIVQTYWLPVLDQLEQQIHAPAAQAAALGAVPPGSTHVHRWAPTGLRRRDGAISVPCLDPACTAELRRGPMGDHIIPDGLPMVAGGIPLDIEDDPQGGVAKIICCEITESYGLDQLDMAGGVVFDVGAHVGVVSCYLGKRYPGITIHAFEPVPANVRRLERNLLANGITNVQVHPVALTGDGRDIGLVSDLAQNSGASSAYVAGAPAHQVPSITLGAALAAYAPDGLALLKLDCEGAEHEILTADPALMARVRALCGEFHDNDGLTARGYTAARLLLLVRMFLPPERIAVEICQIAPLVRALPPGPRPLAPVAAATNGHRAEAVPADREG